MWGIYGGVAVSVLLAVLFARGDARAHRQRARH
jgi:hypothetical protein